MKIVDILKFEKNSKLYKNVFNFNKKPIIIDDIVDVRLKILTLTCYIRKTLLKTLKL